MGESKIYNTSEFLMSHFRPPVERFERKERPFRKETQQDLIILLLEGEIYYCRENQSFERNIICHFRPGDYICPSMLLQTEDDVNYFLARSKGRYATFTSAQLTSFSVDSETWMVRLMKEIYEVQFRKILTHNDILQQKTIRKRLIAYFRSLCEEVSAARIRVPIPYTDLADYLSTDRSAMMKELRKMTDEGLITEDHRNIEVSEDIYYRN